MTAATADLVTALRRAEDTYHTPVTSYEEAWRALEKAIGQRRHHYKAPKRTASSTSRVVTVAGDFHAPFHEPAMLADFIVREGPRTDLLVINGDLSDAYALSRFLLYEHMPFRDEWAIVTAVMDSLASHFPQIQLIIGNHDARLEKQLLTRCTGDIVDAVRYLTGGTLCPLTALAKRYDNVTVVRHRLPTGHEADWFTVVGDAWIGHPEKFSVVPGSALRQLEQAVETHAEEWGLGPARVIVMGHTHQRARLSWRADKELVEPGCLCQTQGYQVTPKIGGTRQRRGYVTFTQDATGRTDLNSLQVFDYDEWSRTCPK